MAHVKHKTLACSSSHPNLKMNQYHTADAAPHVTVVDLHLYLQKCLCQAGLSKGDDIQSQGQKIGQARDPLCVMYNSKLMQMTNDSK